MKKVLCISGSNRNGCTEYVLNEIKEAVGAELVCLRHKKIGLCTGCLYCHNKFDCVVKDDIFEIMDKMIAADIIIFGVPNYFDNVTGLFKNFLDRLHPLYKKEKIEHKPVIFVFIGGGELERTERTMTQSVMGVVDYLQLNVIGRYTYESLDLKEMKKQQKQIDKMIAEIKLLI